MEGSCRLARLRLAQFVDGLTPASVADKGGSTIKGAMLLGVSAPIKGVVGNATWGGFKALAQQPVAAGVDYITSLGRSIATGGKVKTHEFREVVNALTPDGARAFRSGFKAGAKTMVDGGTAGRAAQRALPPGSGFGKWIAAYMDEVQLQLNADVSRLGINTPTQVRIENPVARAFTEAAFAAVEAVDRPFFEGAFQMSHYAQAKLSAVRQGLKGAAQKAEIDRLMANPTDEMNLRSLADAQYATFKDKNSVTQFMENGKRRLLQIANDMSLDEAARAEAAQLSLLIDATIPFTGVPTSIAAKGASLTPLGLASTQLWKGTQAQRSQAIANIGIGAGLIGIGYTLERTGYLRGTPPSATNEREDGLATSAYQAIKVGGKWVGVASILGPLAAPLMAGAALGRLSRENPEAGVMDQAATIAGAVGKNTVETSFMQGTKRTIEALQDPERKGTAFAAGVAGTAIPAVVGQVSRMIDPVDREAKSFTDRLINRTPLRSSLPERGTPFGRQQPKSTTERLGPLMPDRVTEDRDTPATKELRRLSVNVGTPSRQVTVDGEKVTLEPDAYNDLVERRGKRLLTRVDSLINSAGYKAAPDEQKERALRKRVEDIKESESRRARADARRLLQGAR